MSFDFSTVLNTLVIATEVAILATVTVMPIVHAWSRTAKPTPVPAPAPVEPDPSPVTVEAEIPAPAPSRLAELRAKYGHKPPAIARPSLTPEDVEAALQRHVQPAPKKRGRPAGSKNRVKEGAIAPQPQPVTVARRRRRAA